MLSTSHLLFDSSQMTPFPLPRSPPNVISLYSPASPFSAVHMCVDVEPCTGAWTAYEGPFPKLTPYSGILQLTSSSASGETSPSTVMEI